MIVNIPDEFSLPKIAGSGQCFRVKVFPDCTYRFIIGPDVLYIRECGPRTFEVSCSPAEWSGIWSEYFDLATDYASLRAAIPDGDVYLKKAAEAGRGIRILCQDPWEMLITFIASQRKSIPAIKGCVELLARSFGRKLATGREELYLFPTPEELSRASSCQLMECKLGYRAPYVQSAVEKVLGGQLDLTAIRHAEDGALFEALKTVRGVGDKVSNCVCLFAYHRTCLAPVDVWIRRVIDEEYGGVDPFARYGSSAGIMQQYLFYYTQALKGETKSCL